MAELDVDIIKILENTRDAIRANMQTQGVNASGRTSASIRVREYAGGYQLVSGNEGTHEVAQTWWGDKIYANDTAPAPTLEVGRAGGNVPRGFYYVIKAWTREKGLQFNTPSERDTFAYFVAQKIAREGTKRNTDNVDIYTTPAKTAVASIKDALRANVANTVRAALGGVSTSTLKGGTF